MKKNVLCCPACGRNKISRQWPRHGNDEIFSVLWCGYCHFGWIHPFPTHAELKNLYDNQPVYGLDYINESKGGFPIRVKRLRELMPKRGQLLDIGAGLGYFLSFAQADGWQVEGIEPRIEAAKFCHDNFGIKVHEGFLENFKCKSGEYNVVTLWDVLEHVSDHIQFIQRCIDLLAPSGILVISIPNASGWPARIFKGRWRYVMSNHLNYFTLPYIERILENSDIAIERAYHTIKIHSIVQGSTALLPIKVNTQRLFRMGSVADKKPLSQETYSTTATSKRKQNVLVRIRKLAYKLNMTPLPWGIGDMVDLYCRKIS